jgi:hypothetical protein
MALSNKQTLKMLFLGLMAGCSSQKALVKENHISCDTLVQRFPAHVRQFVKDGCYDIGNKRIYMIKGACYSAEKDTIRFSICDSRIERE